MTVRVTVLVRVLLAVVAMGLLVLPVGVHTSAGPEPVTVPRAVAELAGGRVDVSILAGLVEGGELARRSLVRLGVVVAAWAGFVVVGLFGAGKQDERPARRPRRCPHCGFRTDATMPACPSCGRTLSPA